MHTLRLLWPANNETTLQRRQTRVNRRKMVQIVEIEELEFVHRFRLDKQSFWHLCDDLRRLTSLKGTREINLEIKVLCTLRFLATGSYQRIVGLTQHLVQRTTSRPIRQVVEALSHPAILNKWILFPRSQQQRAQIRLEGDLDSRVSNSNLKITDVNPKFGELPMTHSFGHLAEWKHLCENCTKMENKCGYLKANLPPPPIMEVEEDDAQPDNASDSVGAASDQSELLQGRAE
ncbi:unnamed protein product [Parnassius apollo]|uniref:(apollo) hypothetical protein n=1 Tax=Parnassius apollo TaxID=110799 RepID=A0A8S3XJ79_PARAO|nr:unnamed protein product [Parnassius apollo]